MATQPAKMLYSTTPSESETEQSLSSASLETTLTNAGQTVVSGETADFCHETVDASESESRRTQWSSPAYLASPLPVPRTVAQVHGASSRPTADHKPSVAATPGHRPPVRPAAELHEAVSAAFRPPDPMNLLSQLAA